LYDEYGNPLPGQAIHMAGECGGYNATTNASGEYILTIFPVAHYDYFEVNRNDPFNAPGGNNDGTLNEPKAISCAVRWIFSTQKYDARLTIDAKKG